MSIYFSKVIKAGEKQREFNFRQLNSGNEIRYYVDVSDDKGQRIIFNMYKNAGNDWKADAQTLPVWILDAELLIGEAIDDNYKQYSYNT